MKKVPRCGSAVEPGPRVSVTIPLADLWPVHVTAPAPELLTQRNSSHVGLLKREFLNVLRAMKADPAFAAEVISRGKLRAASPSAIVRFLRQAPVLPQEATNDDGAALAALRQEMNLEPVPPSGARRRGRAGAL